MYYECGPILRQRSKAHIPQCCVRTRGNYFCYYYYFTPYLVVHCWMLFLWPAVYHFKKLILRNKRSIKEDYTSTSNLCVRCFRVWRNLLTLVFDLRKLILMLFVRTFSKKKKSNDTSSVILPHVNYSRSSGLRLVNSFALILMCLVAFRIQGDRSKIHSFVFLK